VPYLSALEVCSRQYAIQIHVYLYFYLTEVVEIKTLKLQTGPNKQLHTCAYV